VRSRVSSETKQARPSTVLARGLGRTKEHRARVRVTVPSGSAVAASDVRATGAGEGQGGAGGMNGCTRSGLDTVRWRERRGWTAADRTREAECAERVRCTLHTRGHRVHWHGGGFRRCQMMSTVLSLQHFAKKCAGLATRCNGGDKRKQKSFWTETCSKC
jgi:hypothetical protein